MPYALAPTPLTAPNGIKPSMELPTLPPPDLARSRDFLTTAKRRLKALALPLPRAVFEARAFGWNPGDPDELPASDHADALRRLEDQKLIRVHGETILPPGGKRPPHDPEPLSRLAYDVARLHRAAHDMATAENEAAIYRAHREASRRLEALNATARQLVAQGVTLDAMREAVADDLAPADAERFRTALPWLSEGCATTAGDLWPPEPEQERAERLTPIERAKAAIRHAGPAGITKTALRRAVFSNNAGDFDGLVSDLERAGFYQSGERINGAGRPAVRFFVGTPPVVENETEEARLARQRNLFDSSIMEPMPNIDRFSNE